MQWRYWHVRELHPGGMLTSCHKFQCDLLRSLAWRQPGPQCYLVDALSDPGAPGGILDHPPLLIFHADTVRVEPLAQLKLDRQSPRLSGRLHLETAYRHVLSAYATRHWQVLCGKRWEAELGAFVRYESTGYRKLPGGRGYTIGQPFKRGRLAQRLCLPVENLIPCVRRNRHFPAREHGVRRVLSQPRVKESYLYDIPRRALHALEGCAIVKDCLCRWECGDCHFSTREAAELGAAMCNQSQDRE